MQTHAVWFKATHQFTKIKQKLKSAKWNNYLTTLTQTSKFKINYFLSDADTDAGPSISSVAAVASKFRRASMSFSAISASV